jgi:DDE domain
MARQASVKVGGCAPVVCVLCSRRHNQSEVLEDRSIVVGVRAGNVPTDDDWSMLATPQSEVGTRRSELQFVSPVSTARKSLTLVRVGPATTWSSSYLWRAVDAEGEVLDVLVQSKRNKHAALKLMRKLLRKYAVVPERLVICR